MLGKCDRVASMTSEQLRRNAYEGLAQAKSASECENAVKRLMFACHDDKANSRIPFPKFAAHFLEANCGYLGETYGAEIGAAARLLRQSYPRVRMCKIKRGGRVWGDI